MVDAALVHRRHPLGRRLERHRPGNLLGAAADRRGDPAEVVVAELDAVPQLVALGRSYRARRKEMGVGVDGRHALAGSVIHPGSLPLLVGRTSASGRRPAHRYRCPDNPQGWRRLRSASDACAVRAAFRSSPRMWGSRKQTTPRCSTGCLVCLAGTPFQTKRRRPLPSNIRVAFESVCQRLDI